MSEAVEIKKEANLPKLAGRARLLLGFLMLFSGLYFGLFWAGAGEGLGLLSFLASPFVMVTDK